MKLIWNNCLSLLDNEIEDPRRLSLIRSLRIEFRGSNDIFAFAPSRWALDQFDDKLSGSIRACLNQAGGEDIRVHLDVDPGIRNGSAAGPRAGNEVPSFKPEFTFENFIKGNSNEFAYEVCRQICQPSTHYQHLLICGGVGLGKTHLLHAVGNEISGGAAGRKVLYYHASTFTSRAVALMKERRVEEFSEMLRSADCLLFDDLQFISGKTATQNVLLSIIDSFLLSNKKFIVVCEKYPKSITGLDPRLQSRLCSFVSTAVEPPDRKTRVEILEHKAGQLGLRLDKACCEYIADHISSNVRELEGSLKRVSSLVHFCGKKPDIVTVREALRDIVASVSKSISLDHIVNTVSSHLNVPVERIFSTCRVKDVAQARHICVYFCKTLTRASISEIGRFLGGRDHTTVRHSYKKICHEMDKSPQLHDKVKEIHSLVVN